MLGTIALMLLADVHVAGTQTRDGGIEVRDITFENSTGGRTPAYLVVPREKRAGALFVHWYEPKSPDSNRTQFVEEAVELARYGVVSLLPATMWSEPEWFSRRDRKQDLEKSMEQLHDLEKALDVVFDQAGPGKPVAYIGHDFGAMFGAVLADVDRRPAVYALQAGTSTFSHWYLYGPRMAEPERSEFIEKLKAIDPVTHIGKRPRSPVLLQFGTKDPHLPKQRAEEFIAATTEPKTVLWYDAGHELNEQARRDRVRWLIDQLGLTSNRKSGSSRR